MPILNPPNDPPNSLIQENQTSHDPRLAAQAGEFWTFDMVEARLVETVELWRRMPGNGRPPFATDGPWQLIRAEWGDYADPDAQPRKLPLSRAEYAEMMEASAWLGWLVKDEDRRVVVLAVQALAKGAKQVPWKELLKPMGVARGADGLRMRYGRAINAICKRLNRRNARSQSSSPQM